jgi:glycosyltransferase involved in cell wall biosynthesis
VENRARESIVMITPFFNPNIGGVEVHLEDLCRFLLKRGHRVFVVTFQPMTVRVRAPKRERMGGLELRRMSWFGYNWFYKLEPYPVLQFLYLFPGLLVHSLFFLLRNRRQIKVVHAHGFIACFVGGILKPFFKVTWVVSIHTTYSLPLSGRPWLGRIFASALNGYDKVLMVSEGCVEELLPSGLDPAKVRVFTYWADDETFQPLDKTWCKAKVGWNGKFVVLFVARLIEIKGAHVLVQAARMVNNNIFFAFIATGTFEDFLRMSGKDKLPENVIYVGAVDHSLLNIYYNAADVLAVPSQYAEGFARVNLEAMLCGTPVIASNVGFLPQVINSSVGELVDPPTAENFAKRIQYYFDYPEKLRQLSNNCVKYARGRFTEANAAMIEESYY